MDGRSIKSANRQCGGGGGGGGYNSGDWGSSALGGVSLTYRLGILWQVTEVQLPGGSTLEAMSEGLR